MLQIVDGKLYSGSHDGTIRCWSVTGFRDNTTFGKEYILNETLRQQEEERRKREQQQQIGWTEDTGVNNGKHIGGMILEDENMNEAPVDNSMYYQQYANQYATEVM